MFRRMPVPRSVWSQEGACQTNVDKPPLLNSNAEASKAIPATLAKDLRIHGLSINLKALKTSFSPRRKTAPPNSKDPTIAGEIRSIMKRLTTSSTAAEYFPSEEGDGVFTLSRRVGGGVEEGSALGGSGISVASGVFKTTSLKKI